MHNNPEIKMRNDLLIQNPCGYNMLALEQNGGANGGNGHDIKDRCIQVLQDAGATEEFCEFFSDVLQYEHDMNQSIYRLGENLHRPSNDTDPIEPQVLFKTTQQMTKNFHQWRGKVTSLVKRSKTIPPLKLDNKMLAKSKVIKAVCSIETKELKVKEGDEMTVIDTSRPESVKIRTRKGQEGFIPALSCVLPTPDRNALTACERLQIQLLASWTECLRKIRAILMDTLLLFLFRLSDEWRDMKCFKIPLKSREYISKQFRLIIDLTNQQTPRSDVTNLHNGLFSAEQELTTWNNNGTDLSKMIDTLSNLDKAVLCYQMYRQQWLLYRKGLVESPRPIYVADTWNKLKSISTGKPFKDVLLDGEEFCIEGYYEMKVTYESVSTTEEVTYRKDAAKDTETSSGGCGSHREHVSADQLTSTSGETRMKMIVNGVVDPRTDHVISLQDAVDAGIVDQQTGVYKNLVTNETMPIPAAIDDGRIKVEYTTTRKMQEKTTALGLITIRTKKEDTAYTITGAVDPNSGDKVSLDEAVSRGIIDTAAGYFIISMTDERIPIPEAIEGGWVQAHYDTATGEPEYESKTYAVNSVVDQRLKKKIPFQEAVRKGVIDRNSGNYINNVTHERVYVTEAIRRGFLKGHVVDDPTSMDIDPENTVVVNKMNILRKNILKPMAALTALKRAAQLKKKSAETK